MDKFYIKIISLVFVILIFSCEKAEEIDPCILNPLETNATLKRMIALEKKHNMDSCSINLVSLQDAATKLKTYYFVVTNSSPILQYHFIKNAQIINCEGNDVAEYYSKEAYESFFSKVKFEKTIWKKERNKAIESKGTCGTLNPMEDIPYFVTLKANLLKYAWKSLIYQYNYKGNTVYYGLYTGIDRPETKYVKVAAMTCDGTNLQDLANWDQKDFLENAILEKQVW